MRRWANVWFFLLSALGLIVFASANADTSQAVDGGTVIKNVTVISSERAAPLAHATVVLRDGRIASVQAENAQRPTSNTERRMKEIDGHGGFLIPGLIDSHVHVGNQGPLDDAATEKRPDLLQAYRAQLPRSFLAFGFTSLVDLDLRDKTLDWYDATPVHPNLCSCGRGVHIAGGYGAQRIPKDATAANASNIVYEPTQAKDWPQNLDSSDYSPMRAVARAKKVGAICLKIFYEPGFGGAANWPVFSPATMAALREEATRQGLVMVVHANAVESWRAALAAHADVIAHGLWHWPGDKLSAKPTAEAEDVIKAASSAHVGVQPTLQAVYGDLTIFDKSFLNDARLRDSLPRAVFAYLKSDEGKKAQDAQTDEYRQMITALAGNNVDPPRLMSIAPARAMATMKMMLRENVMLLFGTDTPANEGIGNPPGLNGRLEMSHWADAGVPLPRILRAATLDNATAFGLSDRGTIEVGKRADLLLLRADPLKSTAAYDTIETIFLNGNPLSRASLLPAK